MSECTHDCSSCGESCASREPQSLLKAHHADAHVGKVYGIVSGKGGVGKSMVTSQLAVTMRRRGYQVGILDADITGPSIPKAFGIHDRAMGTENALIPSESKTGIQVMSINLLLENETDPVIWRGPVISGVVQQFWTDVLWNCDYLFVDMPPGTGDVSLSVFQSIPLDGIIIVASPQDLVGMVVEKAVKMAEMMNVPIVGLVENMSYVACPDCGKKIYLFGEGKTAQAAAAHNLPLLAEMPIDPALAESFIDQQLAELRQQIGDKKVLLALSGGVDSSVVAALLIKAIGKQLICVHVNHGLLRKGEPEQVIEVFQNQMDANLIYVDAVDRFLDKLAGISDPEQKRKIIGKEFIDVFAEEAQKLEGISFLAQGTIYPDILESDGIKSHHNVGGLPEDLQFELVEPVKLLYKDEVRVVGKALGLPDNMVYRQPFPGPGLGVRCIGAITRDRLEAVRESDAILREEFAKNGLEGKVWQYFTVVPDIKSTGIIDGKRSFDWPVIIRAVNTVDAVTAEVAQLDFGMMQHIVDRITHEVSGVNRVLWDLTPKPTGTIEWE